MGKNFLKSSLQDASFNIIFQIGFRIVTFLLNAFVLRYLSQAVVGVMNVRLLLLESTILFLSREAFRRACLSKTSEHNWPQVINLIWLTVPLCGVLSGVLGWVWLSVLSRPGPEVTQHYTLGVWAICISCLLEMTVEPIYLVSQAFCFFKLKVLLATLVVLVRTAAFTGLVLWRPSLAVLAFSVAQILAVCLYCSSYCIYFHFYMKNRRNSPTTTRGGGADGDFPFNSLADFLPSKPPGQESMVDLRLCSLTWSFLKQGLVKQILTEGERYVMTLFSVLSFYEQGLYDVVNNLGSLAARFLFRPVEESSYFYFSQLIHRDQPIRQQNVEQMKEAAMVLEQLLRCMCSLGLVVVCFGQSYSRLLLTLYGGSGLAGVLGVRLLRAHCLAVFLLATNGITECFALATMSSTQIDRYNYVMAYLSVGFLFFSWIFTTFLGSVGFIIANCANMATRIFHSIKYIRQIYKDTDYEPLQGIIPGKMFLCALSTSAAVTLASERSFFEDSKVTHFLIGAVCFCLTGAVWIYEERTWVFQSYRRIRRQSLNESERLWRNIIALIEKPHVWKKFSTYNSRITREGQVQVMELYHFSTKFWQNAKQKSDRLLIGRRGVI